MKELISELNQYLNASEGRGNKVIAIDGVRAILSRHAEKPVKAPHRHYHPTVEYLQDRELQRARESSRSLGIH